MEAFIGVLGIALAVAMLVCWIMVLIKIFQDHIGLGILGIFCGLFAFIYGWVKVKQYDIKKVMVVWSICFGAYMAVQVLAVTVFGIGLENY